MPTNEVSEVSLGNVLVKSPTLTNSLAEYTPETKPVRSSLIVGQTRSRRIGMRTELGLSQDGSRVVFNSYGETGGISINLLELDSLEPVLVQDVNLSYASEERTTDFSEIQKIVLEKHTVLREMHFNLLMKGHWEL